MRVTFVSNYLNRHQIPFCEAMYTKLEGQFRFVQTESMEKERQDLGWNLDGNYEYVIEYEKNPEEANQWIEESEAVLIGGTSDRYIQDRLDEGRLVFRIEETIFKNGIKDVLNPHKWNMIYKCHYRYRNKPVYMLCASANLEKELKKLHLYNNKMYKWGYFPETKEYNVDELIQKKYDKLQQTGVIEVVWCARFIWWKHPEYVVALARKWRDKKLPIHVTMIGGGAMYDDVRRTIQSEKLEKYITLTGPIPQEEVRKYMEQAIIFLGTSGREEGWGAVLNEAMNSACIPVVNEKMGAAGYLIQNSENGYLYNSLDTGAAMMEKLAVTVSNTDEVRKANKTIVDVWNAERAAKNLIDIIGNENGLEKSKILGPGQKANS